MDDATGLKNVIPSLLDNKNIVAKDYSLACTIRNGHPPSDLKLEMPAFDHLSEIEISNIVNFLLSDLNKQKSVAFSEIKSQLKKCKQRNEE